MSDVVTVDGAVGEGGGQILRSALTLALVTGCPCRIVNIRARRRRPGLAAQHLTSVHAAQRLCDATVSGAALGSTDVRFAPGSVRPGRYRLAVGTAGAASLIVQTVALPLALAAGPSEISVDGGTHVPWSPPVDYLEECWAPLLARLGVTVHVRVRRLGFYPRGGGGLDATITGSAQPGVLDLWERGPLLGVLLRARYAQLPGEIATRLVRSAEDLLGREGITPEVEVAPGSSPGPGIALFLRARFAHAVAGWSGLGERGKPAERVAAETVGAFTSFLASDAAVDAHMGDQMVLPMALGRGASRVRTARVTQHLLTNVAVVRQFIDRDIRVDGALDEPGTLRVAE